MMSFVEKLQTAQAVNDSWVCVGLDPVLDRMPAPMLPYDDPYLPFLKAIVDATADLVCAYKPNLGFFLALGGAGTIALERIIAYIPDDIPVILDGKFNDIGNTAQAYALGAFDTLGVDAVTVNPYLGVDGIAPFLDQPDRGAYVLARTSNRSARDLQDLRIIGSTDSESSPPTLFEIVSHHARAWNAQLPGTCGLVVGATYPQELATVRNHAPDLPFLIPGVGAQGGDLTAAVRHGPAADGTGPVINTSRGVLYASSGPDFADAARRTADDLRQRINRAKREV
jgi:orotidine-5'-phosphate decarboxylase